MSKVPDLVRCAPHAHSYERIVPRSYMHTLKVWEFGGKLKSLWIKGNPIGLRLSDNITRLQNLELLGNASVSFSYPPFVATYAAGTDVSATQLPQLPLSIYKLTTLKRLYFKCVVSHPALAITRTP